MASGSVSERFDLRYPSSVSDIRIFRNSYIYQDIVNRPQVFFPNGECILGDKAYPSLPWLLVPYINRGNLTRQQMYFNTQQSKGRQIIERSFALLKGRFRRLKYLDMNRIDWVPATVIAACVMHNICITFNDSYIEQYINEEPPLDQNEEEIYNNNGEINPRINPIIDLARDALAERLWNERMNE
ncbi:hypothetical protein NQ315_008787 [Exocentrus adspersus]|uniref:DDE Tnp4 domain-containing protein n=1 Tax=Exocentrus adspersus TaxID=1586481 RepID=A0AAV8VGP7_9CUCU|nr:hypothetical protein NQ315_008787 [Exocentrus adspersus]